MSTLWNQLRLTRRFIVVLCAFAVSLVVVASIGLWSMAEARSSLKILHDENMARVLLAEQSILQIAENRSEVLRAFQHDPQGELVQLHDHPLSHHFEAVAARGDKATKLYQTLQNSLQTPEEIALFDTVLKTRSAWLAKLGQALSALERGDFSSDVMQPFLVAGRKEGETAIQAMVAFRDYQIHQAQLAYELAQKRYEVALWIFGAAALLLVLPSFIAAALLLKRLRLGFASAQRVANQISQCDLSHTMEMMKSVNYCLLWMVCVSIWPMWCKAYVIVPKA